MIQEKVKCGPYGSAGEVVREGLRLLGERDELRELRLAEVRKDLAEGIEQADRGEVEPLDMGAIKAKVRARNEAKR